MINLIALPQFSARYCPNPPLTGFGQNYNWTMDLDLTTVYNTKVDYTCDIAMRLQKNDYNETKYDVQTFLCQWNQTWNYNYADTCVWVACMYPPVPDDRGLAVEWDGEPVDFYANITYTCASNNLFFEDDRDKEGFKIMCEDNGYFDTPYLDEEWPRCVETVYCGEPPGKPRGGSILWDGEYDYDTDIE